MEKEKLKLVLTFGLIVLVAITGVCGGYVIGQQSVRYSLIEGEYNLCSGNYVLNLTDMSVVEIVPTVRNNYNFTLS